MGCVRGGGVPRGRAAQFFRSWSEVHGIQTICVTLGSKGCAVLHGGRFECFHGYKIRVADTVGAGDAFAAAFLHDLHVGWPMDRVVSFANALGALVAGKDGATPPWDLDECRRLMAQGTNDLNAYSPCRETGGETR
jgi:fructokinase